MYNRNIAFHRQPCSDMKIERMLPMPINYLCEVVDNECLNDTTYILTVVCEGLAATARAGQFLHIKCGDARILRRPISICSVRSGALEFAFEVKGEGTRWLSKRKPGEMLDVLGPLGNAFSIPEGNIIVVGGGIGVPPLLLAAELAKGGVTALLGFTDKSRVIMRDAFENACDEVLISTDDGSFGEKGYVTDMLSKLLEGGRYEAVFACGPRPMLRAVFELCQLHGVSCQVSLEERMGCGVGACLVCACATLSQCGQGVVQMSRVCMEGPVFPAHEVVWQT